ncbi:MAG: T9SS type A sorting domain-containing protein [Flavobacteriales bacterium]|nr:T9SS type A sorting domain-containing protein [Flavobacteriales bacterium]
MKITILILTIVLLHFNVKAQIDTVTLTEKSAHFFPSIPVKSSFTSLFDKRTGVDFVYSANMESGLGIYDISNSTIINPVLNWPISNFNNLDVSTIEQRGNSLFVGIGDFQVNTNSSSGLAIVDITNPITPIIKDIWDSTLFDHGISHLIVEGNYAFLSTMTDGIIILDISNENNISFKSHLQLDLNFPSSSSNAHNARGLKYKNDTLYVCFDRGGLRAIDVTNKNNPIEVYKYINTSLNSEAAAAYNDIAIKGNYAFVSVDYCGLEVLDISSIPFTSVQWFNPWGCNYTNWSGANLHTNELILSNNDSLLFVTAGQSESFVFDVTNPMTVSKVGEFVNLNDTLATHGLDVWEDKVILSFIHTPFHIPPFTPFFADPGGLKLLNFSFTTLSTSISETSLNNESLKIYPNPNEGQNLFISCNSELVSIRMMNSTGQLVFVELKINQKEYSVELPAIESGIYFLSIETKEGQKTEKIIIN